MTNTAKTTTLTTEIQRVGPIVYSIRLDTATGEVSEPWAICDHCGAVPTEIALEVFRNGFTSPWSTDYTGRIRLDQMEQHTC